MTATEHYQHQHKVLTEQRLRLRNRKPVFGILRFGTIAALAIAMYFLWNLGHAYALLAAATLLFVFIRLVHKDLANRTAITRLDYLLICNRQETEALNGNYRAFPNGKALEPKEHPYAQDLDIFGEASLFQYLNRTTSEMGAARLADWLLQPANKGEILSRQESIKELAAKVDWRMQLRALGLEKPIRNHTRTRLAEWMHEPTIFLQFKGWKWLRYLLPAIVLSVCVAYAFDFVSIGSLYAALLVFSMLAYQLNKLIAPLHNQLSNMVDDVETLYESISLIESESFSAVMNIQLQAQLKSNHRAAGANLKKLKKLLDKLDLRYNIVVSLPLNILLLWNLQQVLDLEKWKKENIGLVDQWFNALVSFEALNSLSNLHFNEPSWCFTAIDHAYFYLEAFDVAHPLIPSRKRILNDAPLQRSGDIRLVTGSNMGGKSTYLRTLGVNLVLGMTGAPVAASSFNFSPVKLMTSMRVADNLEESTSTFYAELKKLKAIIENVNAQEHVFVLLDEILRGTNSFDRHAGSVALVKQLIRMQAPAILATHDVELAALEKEYPQQISNYHFDVRVKGEELYFDYLLKPGICTSMNASILMKKIGIEL